MVYNLSEKKIWVAGHTGMVGSAIVRRLKSENCTIITADHKTLDLTRQSDVEAWLSAEKPDAIFVAAAKVGGIYANNTYPAEFLYDNLMIGANIIKSAATAGVEKLLFMGSSCLYPKLAPQPLTEDSLLTGSLEPTNEWYAIAKIAGIKMCQAYRKQYGCDFISAMPTSLFGYGDNFHPENSHMIPGLMRRAHEAKNAGDKEMTVWGTGTPMREFLYIDDAADALVFLMKNYNGSEIINIGTGQDVTIKQIANEVMSVVGYNGSITYDPSKPDGTPRKLMNVSTINSLGWQATLSLEAGLKKTYQYFLNEVL